MVSDDADRGMSLVSIECKPETATSWPVSTHIGGVMATPDDVNIGSRCGPNTPNCTTRTPADHANAVRQHRAAVDHRRNRPRHRVDQCLGHTVVRNGVRSNGGGAVKVSGPTGETGMLRSDLEGNGRMDLGDASGNLMLTMQACKEQMTPAMLSAWGKTLCGARGHGRRRRTESHESQRRPGHQHRHRPGSTRWAWPSERGVTVTQRAVMPAIITRLQGVDGEARQTLPTPDKQTAESHNRNTPSGLQSEANNLLAMVVSTCSLSW